jgi:hypothetical protein
MADEVPEFSCRSWAGESHRWIAFVVCDKHYQHKTDLHGPVTINGKPYRWTGVLITDRANRIGDQLFKGERIGLQVEDGPPDAVLI